MTGAGEAGKSDGLLERESRIEFMFVFWIVMREVM
tara:strand:+ start:447 stop:551 length:105 start_codon:yes stop_codon:yes gene_type:complete